MESIISSFVTLKAGTIQTDTMFSSNSSGEEIGILYLSFISGRLGNQVICIRQQNTRKSALKKCMGSDLLEDYGFAVSNVILNRFSLTESLISLRTSSLISECNSSAKKTDLIWFIFLAPVYVS